MTEKASVASKETEFPFEYETVTVKVPKPLMDYLRKSEDNAIETLEYAIVDHVRATMEGMSGMEYIDVFKLGPVFYKELDDKRFKLE